MSSKQISRITVARRGEVHPGVNYDVHVRIPALAAVPWGLVLAYDVRSSPLDLPGEHGIAYRTNTDLGTSWSEPSWLTKPGSVGTGDASLIATDDELLCFYVSSDDKSFWDDTEPGPWGLWLARTPDGINWSHENVTDQLWPEDAGSLFASSGNGIQLRSGRILQPLVIRRRGTQARYVAMAISDDRGRTWRIGRAVEGCDETKVVEIHDGTIVLHSRSTPHRLLAYSFDGGETFTEPVPDFAEPGCNGGLAYSPDLGLIAATIDPRFATGSGTMVDPTGGRGTASGPDWSKRRGLVLRRGILPTDPGNDSPAADPSNSSATSRTQALNWSEPLVIDDGPAAYSVAVALAEGIAVAWEHGAYENIEFALISHEDLPRWAR